MFFKELVAFIISMSLTRGITIELGKLPVKYDIGSILVGGISLSRLGAIFAKYSSNASAIYIGVLSFNLIIKFLL